LILFHESFDEDGIDTLPLHLDQPVPTTSPHFLPAGCPSCHPSNSVKALLVGRHRP